MVRFGKNFQRLLNNNIQWFELLLVYNLKYTVKEEHSPQYTFEALN